MYGEFEILHKVTNEILSNINNEILATNKIVNTSTETQRPPTLMEAVQTQNAKEQEDKANECFHMLMNALQRKEQEDEGLEEEEKQENCV